MLWLKLREKTGYSRSIVSLYRAMIRLGIYKEKDVKYVPTNCMLNEDKENNIKYY